MDSETSSKKSKKKKVKNEADAFKKVDDKGLVRKQKELMRVLHVKNFQLQNGNLSYLDYIELKEELFRLNALKDVFASVSGATE
ncbi:uncharacterized protein LOC131996406 [Stomoxys calcitrans]|uniref:uncharacterized protein LOC131996406 n=1 Tax=Stomoxys calcitrans TaxID=35570 RepID=UPI0027E2FDD6|nr:uncharacterized protein LOC131996406 [Stomoxys calcitrans]